MTDTRDYQADFYGTHQAVRNRRSRLDKAAKITWVLERYCPVDRRGLCVDVGSSSGIMTAALSPLFAQTIGVDFDALALAELAGEDRQRASFLRGDAMRLPLADASVDVVVCAQVYEHVPDDRRLFAELHRILKPGGLLYFSGPNWLFPIEFHYNLPFLHWLSPALADRVLRALGRDSEYYERSRSYADLRRQLAAFTIRDVTPELVAAGHLVATPWARRLLRRLPAAHWPFTLRLTPNFNWLLEKPA
jgi:SAM-dependent methyltransferase